MRRRDFLVTVGAAGAVVAAGPRADAGTASAHQSPAAPSKGRIRQALFRTVFGTNPTMSFDDMCGEAARLGCIGFDLIPMQDWPTLKKHGLVPTMAPMAFASIQDGLIRKEAHEAIERKLHDLVDTCAANGCPNIITLAGQRKGMSYAEAADNCVAFMNRARGYLEEKGVTLCLENTNSRYPDNVLGRPDQACDHAEWGFDVCRRVNSPRVKMLFDIYHAQVQDGNVVATIRDNIQLIAHFHTAGVPGRHEIDSSQELNYRFIASAIADLGFTGSIAHEYRPSPGHDPLKSLAEAVAIMDV
jgi:hydroxypyruvate isomerase